MIFSKNRDINTIFPLSVGLERHYKLQILPQLSAAGFLLLQILGISCMQWMCFISTDKEKKSPGALQGSSLSRSHKPWSEATIATFSRWQLFSESFWVPGTMVSSAGKSASPEHPPFSSLRHREWTAEAVSVLSLVTIPCGQKPQRCVSCSCSLHTPSLTLPAGPTSRGTQDIFFYRWMNAQALLKIWWVP